MENVSYARIDDFNLSKNTPFEVFLNNSKMNIFKLPSVLPKFPDYERNAFSIQLDKLPYPNTYCIFTLSSTKNYLKIPKFRIFKQFYKFFDLAQKQ